ncbi:MAG: hypothetical protein FJW96_05170 [Actinobacteria bacterium]|nr:hypothetical protein [Actinomycetota bacterium]
MLDTFRVPDAIAGERGPVGAIVRPDGRGARILWPNAPVVPRKHVQLGDIRVCARVVEEPTGRTLLAGQPVTGWRRETPVTSAAGEILGWTLRGDDGSLFLPFDPEEAMATLIAEEYQGSVSSSAKSVARRLYYAGRFLVPRSVILQLRRQLAQAKDYTAAFPRWPAEPSLHDLFSLVLTEVERVAGEPLPMLAPWPQGYEWAFVISHDVERSAGLANVGKMRGIETELGFRSAWYFVPERDYRVDDDLVASLTADGFEVGLHGLHHDGRDLNPHYFDERIGRMLDYARRWGAVGFRAPATQRVRHLIAKIGLEYDSSYADVATFEPQSGGTCSLLPFTIGDVVELPITFEQDHTLLEVLALTPAAAADNWRAKAAFIRERQGLGMLLAHPDYMLADDRLAAYRSFLESIAEMSAWHALPRDVSRWWRRRAETALVRDGAGGWVAVGPAADEARVVVGLGTAAQR